MRGPWTAHIEVKSPVHSSPLQSTPVLCGPRGCFQDVVITGEMRGFGSRKS